MSNRNLLVAALCAISLFAQDAPTPEEPASLAGVVTSSLTGDPVLHAHVTLRPMNSGPDQLQYGALSDGEGKFSITQIPPGRYMVSAEKTSYTSGSMMQMVTLGKGEKQTGFKLKLVPGGVITGRVLDAQGDPMENVRVATLGGTAAMTDEEGRYRLGGLAPGRQRVLAAMNVMPIPPEHRTDGSEEPHYATTFYPSSVSAEGAQWVQIRPGAESAGVDIRMVRVPVLKIAGRVAGLPAGTRTALQLRPRSPGPNFSNGGMTQIRADGTFEIWRVSPGKYWLQVGTMGGAESLQAAPLAVDVDTTSVEGLELKMLPAETIQGVVRWDGAPPQDPAPAANTPAGGGSGSKPPMPTRRQLVLTSAAGFSGFGGGNASAMVADDDTFTVQRVAPGKYNLRYSDMRCFVKSTRIGSRESDGNTIDLSNGSGGEQLIVTLSAAVASLSGVVRKGGEPVQGIGVMLVDKEPSSMLSAMRQSRTGVDGSYRLLSVPPGTYKLVVLGPEELTGFMGTLATSEGQEITLAAGENATRDVRYTPASEQQQ